MKASYMKILIIGFLISLPVMLAVIFPQFKWIFFLVVAVEIYAVVSRILHGAMALVVSGILIYVFYQLWWLIAPLFMLYWIAGSLGFGMIISTIIFGIKGKH